MDPRITRLLAAVTALTALGAAVAGAQDTTKTKPRSSRSIPIKKEAAGEIAKPIHDTVTVFKTDTLRLTTPPVTIHDTVTRTNTVTHVDTVTVTPPVPPVRLPNGMYLGFAGGLSTPAGALFNPNNTGPSAQFQVGWQDALKVFGVRADVNFTRPAQDAGFVTPPDPPHGTIWNLSLDAKAQLPFLHHTFGTSHLFSLYAIGGYTHTSFKNLGLRVDSPDGSAVFTGPVDSWQNQNGWNAGGGASLMWGHTELFIESRVLAFTPDNAPMARQLPFMFGLNWY
ncbi:MAG TPA: hypothetical protein VGQ44_10830 [Gemmatimonadaceae bacterium]|jgi:hypothetical protein|nr:hypothetical protein [Gemmatimonadaceae bacterium]